MTIPSLSEEIVIYRSVFCDSKKLILLFKINVKHKKTKQHMPIITIQHATNFTETVDGLDDRLVETFGWFETKSVAVDPLPDRDLLGRLLHRQRPIVLEPFVFEPEPNPEEEYVKEFWDAADHLKAFDILYILACVGRVNMPIGTVPCLECMREGFTQGGFTFCHACREHRGVNQNDEDHDYGPEPRLLRLGSWSWGLEEMKLPIEEPDLDDQEPDDWSDEDDWSEGTGFTPEFM